MPPLLKEYKQFWNERNRKSLYLGLLLLVLALTIQVQAAARAHHYAVASPFVSDLILDNIPTYDLEIVIVQGALLVFAIGLGALLLNPRYLLFGMKSVALFIMVRAMFLNLTHVGIIPRPLFIDDHFGVSLYNYFNFEGNYFFSGHTGMPLLIALVFWPKKGWRYFFLGVSTFFAVAVLLAHVHYSIDVFAAPFVTYGIFKISQWLFSSDYALFYSVSKNEAL